MDNHLISTDLTDLENRLRKRHDPRPAVDLRDRVLRAVAAELAQPRQSSSVPHWQSGWWAAVAAGILIIMNLSMICASDSAFSARAPTAPRQLATDLQDVRLLESQLEGSSQ